MAGEGREVEQGNPVTRRQFLKKGVIAAAAAAVGGILGAFTGGRAASTDVAQPLSTPAPMETPPPMPGMTPLPEAVPTPAPQDQQSPLATPAPQEQPLPTPNPIPMPAPSPEQQFAPRPEPIPLAPVPGIKTELVIQVNQLNLPAHVFHSVAYTPYIFAIFVLALIWLKKDKKYL